MSLGSIERVYSNWTFWFSQLCGLSWRSESSQRLSGSVLTRLGSSSRDGGDVFDQTGSSSGRPATAYGFRPDEQPLYQYSEASMTGLFSSGISSPSRSLDYWSEPPQSPSLLSSPPQSDWTHLWPPLRFRVEEKRWPFTRRWWLFLHPTWGGLQWAQCCCCCCRTERSSWCPWCRAIRLTHLIHLTHLTLATHSTHLRLLPQKKREYKVLKISKPANTQWTHANKVEKH